MACCRLHGELEDKWENSGGDWSSAELGRLIPAEAT
jgi:hypothetical protein